RKISYRGCIIALFTHWLRNRNNK
ncbi:TPA: type I toxin-antitoxin system Fst family toxin, partial [Staphylococcus aureus]